MMPCGMVGEERAALNGWKGGCYLKEKHQRLMGSD